MPIDKTRRSSPSLIPDGVLPSYLALAFGDIYEEDGLVCLGKGLGWLTLLASLVRFYADTSEDGHMALVEQHQKEIQQEEKRRKKINGQKFSETQPKPQHRQRPPLVLVLGLHDKEHEILLQVLESWGTPHEFLPTIITNESGQSKDRAALYRRGGVFCVTSRILIVDFLTSTINSDDVDGLLIAHAEQVTGDSTEAFIIRIYTTQRRRDKCFIKAFSDSPEGLVTGFANTDKVLKALQVRNLYLYPRFHEAVQDELSGRSLLTTTNEPSGERLPPIIVEELQIGLSPKMKDIQSAIVTAVKGCMNELKKSTPMVEWNQGNDDLRIENCVTSNFDRAVSKQLEKDWHRLKPSSKQLVQDLRTLRTLFQYLIQHDCVSFWKLINTIKTMSSAGGGPSRNQAQALWLLTPAAQLIFKRAKERLYVIEEGNNGKTPILNDDGFPLENPIGKLKPVLEESKFVDCAFFFVVLDPIPSSRC
jgi:DNA excision repair protein ERCC-4